MILISKTLIKPLFYIYIYIYIYRIKKKTHRELCKTNNWKKKILNLKVIKQGTVFVYYYYYYYYYYFH